MANWDPTLLTPSLTSSPNGAGAASPPVAGVDTHHALVAIVLVAVLVLFLLDRAGFRFAVAVGKG